MTSHMIAERLVQGKDERPVLMEFSAPTPAGADAESTFSSRATEQGYRPRRRPRRAMLSHRTSSSSRDAEPSHVVLVLDALLCRSTLSDPKGACRRAVPDDEDDVDDEDDEERSLRSLRESRV